MVIKMDKSDEFIKSGKKLISEYDGANLEDESKPELLTEGTEKRYKEYWELQEENRNFFEGFTTPSFFACCYNQQCRLRGQKLHSLT